MSNDIGRMIPALPKTLPGVALFGVSLRVMVLEADWGAFERVEVMQTIQLAVAKQDLLQSSRSVEERVSGWISRLFGCWHREMSRPFSHHGQAYRSCLNCGAQRKFNLNNWSMQGAFYYNGPKSTRQAQLGNRIRLVARAN